METSSRVDYLYNVSSEQKKKAEKALEKAKANEENVPEGYEWKWVDGGLRSKKRVLVKISNQ